MNPVNLFKALADTTRLRLFNVLLHNELNVNEIVDIMGMGQSRISRHLKILTDSNLLSSRRDGLWVFYTVNKKDANSRFVESIAHLLKGDEQFREELMRTEGILNQKKNSRRRFFDTIADDWDRLKKEILNNFDPAPHILNMMDRCSVAVDLGCGTGYLLSQLTEKAEKVIGVDSSPKMLEIARRRFSHNAPIELRLGELEHLPIRDRAGDCAILNMVLHHLPQPINGVREVNRILRKGKKLIIVEFDKHKNESLRTKFGDHWLGFHRHEITGWLSETGFEPVDLRQFPLRGLTVNIFLSVKRNRI